MELTRLVISIMGCFPAFFSCVEMITLYYIRYEEPGRSGHLKTGIRGRDPGTQTGNRFRIGPDKLPKEARIPGVCHKSLSGHQQGPHSFCHRCIVQIPSVTSTRNENHEDQCTRKTQGFKEGEKGLHRHEGLGRYGKNQLTSSFLDLIISLRGKTSTSEIYGKNLSELRKPGP